MKTKKTSLSASLLLVLTLLASVPAESVKAYPTEPYNWGQVVIGGGGNISCLVIHPKVMNVMYLGADVGGVDRWDVDQKKWIPTLNYYGAPQGVDALAVDPSDATGNIVYAAVGSDDWKVNGVILKSTNRGEKWTPSVTRFPNCSNGDQGWNNRIAVDPANGLVIYFAARNGLWRSTDAGVNWVNLTAAPGGDQSKLGKATGVAGDVMVILDPTSGTVGNPTRTRRVYVSPLGSPLYKTEDGGETWSVMPDAPKDINAADIDPAGILYCASRHGGVTKYSGGNSGTWSDITPEKLAAQKEGFGSIQVDPFDKNNILAMENYMPCYSKDGGATWAYIAAQGANQSETATPDWYSKVSQSHFGWGGRNLRFDPFRRGTVWESDAYLTWKTADMYAKMVHWESFTAGHEEVVGTSGLISPPSGKTLLYSGAADVYGFRHTSLTDWPTEILLGRYNTQLQIDGADFEEADPNFVAFVGAGGWNGPGNGGYTTDGGETFRSFANIETNPSNQGGRIAVSATSRNMVWATGWPAQAVSYSTDMGATWKASAGLPPSPAHLGGSIFYFMSPLCSDRINGNKFYLYSKDGTFYRSMDGGAHFSKVASGLPSTINANLVANFAKEGELWLSLHGIGLWHSVDSGTTWSRVANVQTCGMVAIGKGINAITPALYLIGKVDQDKKEHVFRSDNLGKSWIKIDIERPYPNGWVYMCGDRQTYGTVYVESSSGVYYGQKAQPNSSFPP